MKDVTYHEGILQIIERLPQSRNGNARFLIAINDGYALPYCRTAVDSSLTNNVKNYVGKRVKAGIGTLRGYATLDSLELAKESSRPDSMKTLDYVLEQFDFCPSNKVCADLIEKANQYHRDEMIGDEEFEEILLRVAEWLAVK